MGTPLEDQENNFGRHRATGAPIGMKQEMDSPEDLSKILMATGYSLIPI